MLELISSQRITRDELFISTAFLMSLRATCERLKVGAVLVKDKRIISCGYNGSLPDKKHCGSQCDLETHCKEAVHAEANAIAYAARYGITLLGSTIYCTHTPCIKCAELIIQAGISEMVYHDRFRDTYPLTKLAENGLSVRQVQLINIKL